MASLREQAEAIWRAGVDSVSPASLIAAQIAPLGNGCCIGPVEFEFDQPGKIEVLGAGKAGAQMALGLEQALFQIGLPANRLSGWINIPESPELPELKRIHLHPARPQGLNEPTIAAMAGTEEILGRASSLQGEDLCIVLLSGGGSALLPAPIDGVALADKQRLTRFLSRAGANIEELNGVRSCLSRIKGGGLARHCRAGTMIVFVISDVLGDPLSVIASGPCLTTPSPNPHKALETLQRFDPQRQLPSSVYAALERAKKTRGVPSDESLPEVIHEVIGNNAIAVDSAGIKADKIGWKPAMISERVSEGPAEAVGKHLADMVLAMLSGEGADCLISGGEPTVHLPANSGKGGRNQQLVLAAALELLERGLDPSAWDRICILSGGTDGEDGPTDAAGGVVDGHVLRRLATNHEWALDHLRRCDSYSLLNEVNGLLRTGPTGTNVCDLRVVLVQRDH